MNPVIVAGAAGLGGLVSAGLSRTPAGAARGAALAAGAAASAQLMAPTAGSIASNDHVGRVLNDACIGAFGVAAACALMMPTFLPVTAGKAAIEGAIWGVVAGGLVGAARSMASAMHDS